MLTLQSFDRNVDLCTDEARSTRGQYYLTCLLSLDQSETRPLKRPPLLRLKWIVIRVIRAIDRSQKS